MNDPDSSLFFYILLLLFLILGNAFFAMSELALITLNDAKVRHMAQDGDKKAQKILALTSRPSQFLATIQVGVTLSGFLASAIAADTFAERIVVRFSHTPIPPNVLHVAALIVITFLLSFLTLVFGELVPKRVAMRHYEKIAFAVAPALSFLMIAEKPFVALLSATTNGVLRLMGIDPDQKPEEVTEEEIRMMIDVGNESGAIENQDKLMINNIFDFDDRSAAEIMTHRTEIDALEVTASLGEAVGLARDTGYSRIPVFEEDLDNIIGILYVKDLLDFVARPEGEFSLRQYMREPLFVLESTSCKKLLALLREEKIQMAVVVDEYGGTAGIITMEDLLESIVGEIQDEYDDEEADITQMSENLYVIDGTTPIDDVERYFDLDCGGEEDFDTIGGYMIDRIGRIPAETERPSVTVGDMILTVLEMNDRRIDKIEARRQIAEAEVEQQQMQA